MRLRTLGVTAAAILLVLACSACKSSDLPPSPASLINGTRDRLNPFRMTLSTDPTSPRASGPITLKVHVIDAANQPADGVTLKADVSMAGMSSGDQHLTLDGHGNGDYDGRVNLDMAGSWDVNLTASRDGKSQQLKLFLDVGN
ncbi:MAG: FixH family protein [Terracidiphilus sp.]|nr:FixH family protein [Terracidiphilus sp.]